MRPHVALRAPLLGLEMASTQLDSSFVHPLVSGQDRERGRHFSLLV